LATDNFRVVFGINDAHSLVIATYERGQLFALQENTTGAYEKLTKSIELKGDLHKVLVELISESESKVVAKTEFVLEVKQGPEYGIVLVRPIPWKHRKITTIAQAGRALIHRFKAGELGESQAEQEFADWKLSTLTFLKMHISDSLASRFNPPPHVPPPGSHPAFRPLASLLEPPDLEGKIRAKVETLERFANEIT
jgi:hypothetical protein